MRYIAVPMQQELQGFYICGQGVDQYNPNAIRASLGTLFAVPTMAADHELVLKHLRQHNFKIAVATPEAVKAIHETEFPSRCAFVIGSEATGVSAFWREHADFGIRIPMSGIADSLNASISAGVTCVRFYSSTS